MASRRIVIIVLNAIPRSFISCRRPIARCGRRLSAAEIVMVLEIKPLSGGSPEIESAPTINRRKVAGIVLEVAEQALTKQASRHILVRVLFASLPLRESA